MTKCLARVWRTLGSPTYNSNTVSWSDRPHYSGFCLRCYIENELKIGWKEDTHSNTYEENHLSSSLWLPCLPEERMMEAHLPIHEPASQVPQKNSGQTQAGLPGNFWWMECPKSLKLISMVSREPSNVLKPNFPHTFTVEVCRILTKWLSLVHVWGIIWPNWACAGTAQKKWEIRLNLLLAQVGH